MAYKKVKANKVRVINVDKFLKENKQQFKDIKFMLQVIIAMILLIIFTILFITTK